MRMLTLDRILQSQGFGSRRYCRDLISAGEVSIDGSIVEDYRTAHVADGLRFSLFGEEWLYREHVYIALNKPANFECSRKPSHHPGVLTILPEQFSWRDVQPVGRLDHDTTGLLLMSDDGPFIHAQSSPKRHIPKLYRATTDTPVTPALIGQLMTGVQLHDEPAPLAARSCRTVADDCLKFPRQDRILFTLQAVVSRGRSAGIYPIWDLWQIGLLLPADVCRHCIVMEICKFRVCW